MAVLNNVVLLIAQSHLSMAQAKRLHMHMFTYNTPTFITEVHRLVTRVQLLLTTVTVN